MPLASSRVLVTIMHLLPRVLGVASAAMLLASPARAAVDAPSTIAALRIAGTVTGGLMPTSGPEFTQMVAAIQGGDRLRAATLAANSNYAARSEEHTSELQSRSDIVCRVLLEKKKQEQ